MRLSISNNTSSYISSDVASLQPGGKTIVTVEDDKLEETLAELDKLGSNITYRVLDQSPLSRSVITSPLTLYVSTSGDDSNAGTARDPFKTIQAALDSLKGVEISAAVTIKVGAGNFSGFATPTLTMGQLGTLTIEGTLVIVDTGTATGFTTVDGFFNVVDTSKTWTTGEHVGRFLQWTTNTGVFVNQPIGTNSATQISVSTNVSNFGSGVTAYQIASIGTFITSPATASTITTSNIVISAVGTARTLAGGFTIRYIESASNAGVSVRWGAYATLSGCAIRGSVSLINGCSLTISNSYLSGGTLSNSSCIGVSSTVNTVTALSLSQSVLSVSGATGTGISLSCTGGTSTSISLVQIRCSGGVGINVVGGQAALSAAGIWGATTAVRAHQSAFIISPSAGIANSSCILYGSGNTTAIDCTKGSRVSIASTSTITGTTEISVDGATSTLAATRALSPKVFPATPNAYGSYVYE